MNVPTKFEVRSFARSQDSRGYPQKIGQIAVKLPAVFVGTHDVLLQVS